MFTRRHVSFLFIIAVLVGFNSDTSAKGMYYDELKALKKREDKKDIFDKSSQQNLARIQANLDICKELSFFQRLLRCLELYRDVVIVTSDTMPQLYAYVDEICKEESIATPTIFVTRKKVVARGFQKGDFIPEVDLSSFLVQKLARGTDGLLMIPGAIAEGRKVLMSSGAIIIGQELLVESSDKELEAIIARELGHIKYNHFNKMVGLGFVGTIAFALLGDSPSFIENVVYRHPWELFLFAFFSCLALNRKFEKHADEFACEVGEGEGLIEFFKHIKTREQEREDQFAQLSDLLTISKNDVGCFDRVMLRLYYYLVKAGYSFNKIFRWIGYNTPLGTHPSPQARIDAAKAYLAQQQ
jgi:Zn-dependent protease with chaperone function